MARTSDQAQRYLQAVFELAEDAEHATQVSIGRRIGRSAATVSQATAGLARRGLIRHRANRRIHLTPAGGARAVAVVRRHRLVECLLHRLVKLEWSLLHDEALRWQHVVTDPAEAKIAARLGHPRFSPFGYPIPAAGGAPAAPGAAPPSLAAVAGRADGPPTGAVVLRIAESMQADVEVLTRLHGANVVPGARVSVVRSGRDAVRIRPLAGDPVELDLVRAAGIFSVPDRLPPNGGWQG